MSDLPVFDDLYALGQAEITARATALTDFSEGSVLDAIVGAGGVVADDVIGVLLREVAKLFFDTAAGTDLDALVADRWGSRLQRKPATAAIGHVTLTRGSGASEQSVSAGQQISGTVDGQTVAFTLDATATFGIGVTTLPAVAATCTEAGRDGNVDAAVIDTVHSAPVGIPDLAVTNPQRFAGGADEETDAQLRERARDYSTTLRKGTKGAIEAGAKSVPGVSFATATDARVAPTLDGYVSVFVGDPDGGANDALVALVETELATGGDDETGWTACGVDVRVFAAVRETVPVTLVVTIRRGADRAALREAIAASVLDYTDNLDPGETLYLPQIESRTIRVSAADVVTAQVTAPTADRAPTAAHNALRVIPAGLFLIFVEV